MNSIVTPLMNLGRSSAQLLLVGRQTTSWPSVPYLAPEASKCAWIAEDQSEYTVREPLRAAPVTLREAREFVAQYHRHLSAPAGGRFALGATCGGVLIGVAIVGRPTARRLDDGVTAEVTRVATDGTPNACSFLLSRVARIVRLMGYTLLITYTLPEEGGASLRATGWIPDGRTSGGSWSRPSRPRQQPRRSESKLRWRAW